MIDSVFPFLNLFIEPKIIHDRPIRHSVNQRKQRKKWRQAPHTRPNKNRK